MSIQGFWGFILRQPSIIDHPICSLDFPEIFSQYYAPLLYKTDILKNTMNSESLIIFTAGQQAASRYRPTYDGAAVEIPQASCST